MPDTIAQPETRLSPPIRFFKWRKGPDGKDIISNDHGHKLIRAGCVEVIRTGGATYCCTPLETALRRWADYLLAQRQGRNIDRAKNFRGRPKS